MCNVRNDRRHYHHMLPCKVGHFGFWMIKACLLLRHCSSLHSEDVWLCRWVHSTGSPTFAVWEKDSPQTPHFIVPDPLLTGNIPGAMTVFFFFFLKCKKTNQCSRIKRRYLSAQWWDKSIYSTLLSADAAGEFSGNRNAGSQLEFTINCHHSSQQHQVSK